MYDNNRVGMIIPAAGIGSRMGGSVKKQHLMLKGKTILRRTLESLVEDSVCDEVILVVGSDEVDGLYEVITCEWHLDLKLKVISGGKNRQESVERGLSVLEEVDYVFVHDGVRPFAKKSWLPDMIEILKDNRVLKGVSVGKPVTDTLKEVSDKHIAEKTLDREKLWSVQTPQLFLYDALKQAHQSAIEDCYTGTDDASLIERNGGLVKLVYFGDENIKLTTPFDMVIAEAILNQRV